MLAPGGTGNDQYEVDANGKIVPRKSNAKNFYTTEWNNGVPKQVSHPVGPRVTPPVWDAGAQAADDASSAKWQNYLTTLPGMNPTAPAQPQANTAASLLSGTTPPANQPPAQSPVLGKNAMARQLSPLTMVSMNSPLQNGLWGYNLWNKR